MKYQLHKAQDGKGRSIYGVFDAELQLFVAKGTFKEMKEYMTFKDTYKV